MDRHLSLDDNQSVTSLPPPASNDNFDKVLYRNLVEMVPLVESLMDRRSKTSFNRPASLIYTKTPAKDLNSRKAPDAKGRKAIQAVSIKKQRDTRVGDNTSDKHISKATQDASGDGFSILTSKSLTSEKEREELLMLREQVEELQKKLVEKDRALKSAEESINNISLVQMEVENLKIQMEEKDSLIRSAHLQLSDAKIKLADKQAALEKLEWEAKKSSDKADENVSDNHEHEKMQIVRNEYLEAVAVAKVNLDEDSLSIASQARLNLLSFVSGLQGM